MLRARNWSEKCASGEDSEERVLEKKDLVLKDVFRLTWWGELGTSILGTMMQAGQLLTVQYLTLDFRRVWGLPAFHSA
jgi:hypothetical protein